MSWTEEFMHFLKFKLSAGLNCTLRDTLQMTYLYWLWLLLNWMVFATRGLCLRHLNKKLCCLKNIWDAKRFGEICPNFYILHQNIHVSSGWKCLSKLPKLIIMDIWGIDCLSSRPVKYLLLLLPTYLHSKRCQNSSVPWVNTYLSLQ